MNAHLSQLLATHGDDIFRLKGILSIADDDRRYVLQAVHRIMELRPADAWEDSKPGSKFVFIGRKLDRPALEAGLLACLEREKERES